MNKENKQKRNWEKIDRMVRENFLKVWKCIKVHPSGML